MAGMERNRYEWEFGSQDQVAIVNPNEDIVYTVTVSDECGSESIAKVGVTFEEHDPINVKRVNDVSIRLRR